MTDPSGRRRDSPFYRDVAGSTTSTVDMLGFSEFCMHSPGEEHPAVCNARVDEPHRWQVRVLAGHRAPFQAQG